MNKEVKDVVRVNRILYHNQANGWGVFSYINNGNISELEDTEVKVSGNFDNIYEDSEIEFTGTIEVHPTYGKQIALTSYKILSNSTSKQGIIDFLTKSSISGIAYANANKIYEKYKDESIDVVLNKTHLIKQINGIGDKTYKKVLKSVDKYKEQEELLNFCHSLGNIPYIVINKLYETYKQDAIKILKTNPYSIIDTSDLTFKQVDNIAIKMGIDVKDTHRLKAGLLYTLKEESILKGSTGCNFQDLNKYFSRDLGINDVNLYQYTINELTECREIVVEFNQVFLKDFYLAEKDIANYINCVSNLSSKRTYNKSIIQEELQNFPFTLNSQQVEAIKGCLDNHFSIITGQGGTGKSSITKAVVNILNRHEENVILLSPTGKASKRLEECTDFPAQTIHRFLKVKTTVQAVKPEPVPNNTTIIVDEASMVDVILLEKIISSTVNDTRIILIGDTHQLPSVQAGNVLEDIINSNIAKVYTLTDIMRQAQNSNIIKYCAEVNLGNTFEPMKSKDFIYLNFNLRESIEKQLKVLYSKAVSRYGLLETQVISPYKLGSLGINELNKLLKLEVNQNQTCDKFNFSIGDKVKHNKNNYNKNVFNGETGIVKDIKLAEDIFSEVNEDTLYVDYGDRVVEYNKNDINEIQLAYASTVHSSQGSEYQIVFVILDNEVSNNLLFRKVIYTALSRAKKMCILLSTGNCVSTAICNNFYKKRITKLQEFLTGEENDDFN